MIARFRWAALVLTAVLCLPILARADDEPRPFPLWITLHGGGMFPKGQEGSGLGRGGQATGSLGFQINKSFMVSGDLGYVSSTDVFKTGIVLAGCSVRINPNPEVIALYVQGGAAIYDIFYDTKIPGAPPTKFRPGLSFGAGYDIGEVGRVTIGVLGLYHGIVIARSDALAYLTLGAYVSLRPPEF